MKTVRKGKINGGESIQGEGDPPSGGAEPIEQDLLGENWGTKEADR